MESVEEEKGYDSIAVESIDITQTDDDVGGGEEGEYEQ